MLHTLHIDGIPVPWTIEHNGRIVASGEPPELTVELESGTYVIISDGAIELELMEDEVDGVPGHIVRWRHLPVDRRIQFEGSDKQARIFAYPLLGE